ncbi:hypothetical protein RF11_00620 [Thelohanellus kitauei]|uniref:Uncharacterized protein n=1 Tax=Thelohanellus kitauei TaxID=669202 RepID=A0A0C2N0T3_THEKT|nr:hypothetical protein RF11_00620 [Thelohanellus kitauei]
MSSLVAICILFLCSESQRATANLPVIRSNPTDVHIRTSTTSSGTNLNGRTRTDTSSSGGTATVPTVSIGLDTAATSSNERDTLPESGTGPDTHMSTIGGHHTSRSSVGPGSSCTYANGGTSGDTTSSCSPNVAVTAKSLNGKPEVSKHSSKTWDAVLSVIVDNSVIARLSMPLKGVPKIETQLSFQNNQELS